MMDVYCNFLMKNTRTFLIFNFGFGPADTLPTVNQTSNHIMKAAQPEASIQIVDELPLFNINIPDIEQSTHHKRRHHKEMR